MRRSLIILLTFGLTKKLVTTTGHTEPAINDSITKVDHREPNNFHQVTSMDHPEANHFNHVTPVNRLETDLSNKVTRVNYSDVDLINQAALMTEADTRGTPQVALVDRGNKSLVDQSPPVELEIGFLPALTEKKAQSKYFAGAFIYALETANRRLSHKYHLNYQLFDNKADTAESIRGMTSQYLNGTIAFIGPEDTCATEARIAAAWNVPMIAFVSRSSLIEIVF